MLIKATSFHVYTHQDSPDDSIENCSICDIAVQNQNSEFTLIAIFVLIILPLIIYTDRKIVSLVFDAPSFFFPYAQFGRPPPFQS